MEEPAVEHIGIDVHKNQSQICILSDDGELIERGIRTSRERFAAVFHERPRARILIEASTESEWVARSLEDLGHDVIVADPNYAPMYAQRSRKIKTDKRDARALAEACRLGAYRPAHRMSDERRHMRAILAVREALVRTRARWIVLIRPLLRREGFRIRSGKAETFVDRVEELDLPEHLEQEIAPLLRLFKPLNEQIDAMEDWLAGVVQSDEVAKRLTTVPGVGPVTAVSFVSTLDEAERFRNAHQVESYLGLVPREWSSAEVQRKGRITKAGNGRMRWLLVEAAWCILRRRRKPETAALRDWAERISLRRGKTIAAVALARRLAGILYAMWRDATAYDPTKLGTQTSTRCTV
jgi:transposase